MSTMACRVRHVSAELNREHFEAVVLILRSEFKYGNLRPGHEPDGKAGGTDAEIDVKLCASVFVPSVGMAIDQATEVELTVDGLQRQLPAMRVPGQHQVNAQLGGAIQHAHRRFVC